MMEETKSYIAVNTKSCSMRVDVDEILYIERRYRKIRLVTETDEVEYYDKLSLILPLLNDDFFSVLQGFYVNLYKIKSVREGKCIFSCGKEVPLSEKSYAKLKIKHNAFYRIKQLENLRKVGSPKEKNNTK